MNYLAYHGTDLARKFSVSPPAGTLLAGAGINGPSFLAGFRCSALLLPKLLFRGPRSLGFEALLLRLAFGLFPAELGPLRIDALPGGCPE